MPTHTQAAKQEKLGLKSRSMGSESKWVHGPDTGHQLFTLNSFDSRVWKSEHVLLKKLK